MQLAIVPGMQGADDRVELRGGDGRIGIRVHEQGNVEVTEIVHRGEIEREREYGREKGGGAPGPGAAMLPGPAAFTA